ncbi:MAG: phosphotransferase, partial [Candidatus Limnocylindrales bacterium]
MLSGARPPTRTEVRDSFGIDVDDLRAHEGGFEADAFTDGRWFVKRWRYDTPDQRALTLTHDLAARGLPVPGAVRAVDGRYTAEHDGKEYAVFPFVRGRNATWADQAAIAAVMSELHAIDDLDLPRIESDMAYGPMLRELVDHPWLAKYRGEIEAHVDRLEAVLERTKAIDVPHVVCHYDMQPHNVLVDDGALVAEVDWCWGELAPREHDMFVAFC